MAAPGKPAPGKLEAGKPEAGKRAVGRLRCALGVLGAAVLGYGVYGLLTEPAIGDLWNVGEWLVAGLLLHDAVLAPLVFAACALAYRVTGARLRGRLAALLLVGGSLVLISVPALLQKGRNPNTTVLPLDYARNLGVLLAVVAGGVALYAALDARRRRRARRRQLRAAQPNGPDGADRPAGPDGPGKPDTSDKSVEPVDSDESEEVEEQ